MQNYINSPRMNRIRKQQRNQKIWDFIFTAAAFAAVAILAWIVIGDYVEARQMLEAAKAGTL